MAAEEEGEEPKQVEQESDHRAEIVAGSEPTDQPLDRRARFWRRTGYSKGPPGESREVIYFSAVLKSPNPV